MDPGLKNFLNHIDEKISKIEKDQKEGEQNFDKFVKDVWAKPNLILSIVLLGHIYVESLINNLLKKTFIESKKLEKYTFAKKVEIIESVGAIDKKYIEKLRALNKIRNALAHNLDYNIPQDLAQKFSPGKEDLDLFKKDPAAFMFGEVSQLAGYLNSAIASQRKISRIKLADNVGLLKLMRKNAEKDKEIYKKYFGFFR